MGIQIGKSRAGGDACHRDHPRGMVIGRPIQQEIRVNNTLDGVPYGGLFVCIERIVNEELLSAGCFVCCGFGFVIGSDVSRCFLLFPFVFRAQPPQKYRPEMFGIANQIGIDIFVYRFVVADCCCYYFLGKFRESARNDKPLRFKKIIVKHRREWAVENVKPRPKEDFSQQLFSCWSCCCWFGNHSCRGDLQSNQNSNNKNLFLVLKNHKEYRFVTIPNQKDKMIILLIFVRNNWLLARATSYHGAKTELTFSKLNRFEQHY